jgi:hypothetical protein
LIRRLAALAAAVGCAAGGAAQARLAAAPLAPGVLAPPAVRYEAPGPASRPEGLAAALAARVEATAARLHRPHPVGVARLDAAARDLAMLLPENGTPPLALVEFALRRHGIVEPAPHLIVAAVVGPVDERSVVADIEPRLPGVLSQGKYNRLGVGSSTSGGRTRVVVALGESYLRMRAIRRELPAGDVVTLDGAIFEPFRAPNVVVDRARPAVERHGLGFRASFPCRGRYQIEVTGEDVHGTQVLANFPVFCGVSAPQEPPTIAAAGAAVRGPDDAERRVFELANQDRRRASLPTLRFDAELARVARAHSEDMRDHDFVGHISPRTGNAVERMHRAR